MRLEISGIQVKPHIAKSPITEEWCCGLPFPFTNLTKVGTASTPIWAYLSWQIRNMWFISKNRPRMT